MTTMPKKMALNKNTGSAQTKMSELFVPGFRRTIPKFVPDVSPEVTLYECLECGDKFALKSSYDFHINRRSAAMQLSCGICQQPQLLYNSCQVLAHVRRHLAQGALIAQADLDAWVTVSPLTQQEFQLDSLFKRHEDLDQARDAFLQTKSHFGASNNFSVPNLSAMFQQNGVAERLGKNVTSVASGGTAGNVVSGANSSNAMPNTGLLILNTNQNMVPGLINPFSNHNLIFTENGIVAVPNLQASLSPFQMQQPTTTAPATATSTTVVSNQNCSSEITIGGNTNTANFNNTDVTTVNNKSVLKPQNNTKTPDQIVVKQDASPDNSGVVKKPAVFLKDIGTLLKAPVANNNAANAKTLPNPVVAWSSNGDRMCVECNTQVKHSLTLREHYMSLRGAKNIPTCSTCGIQLPSKCALSCHMRLHTRLPPFICPDCVIRFSSFAQLTEHMNKVCFHMDKRARQKCPLDNCTTKLFPSPNAFMKHLAVQHMKSIFKCNLCPIACYTKPSLTQHMAEKHFGCTEIPSPYYQCALCPDRLIPKSRLDQHIEEHAQCCTKMNVYLCKKCNKFNMLRNDHIVHTGRCKGTSNVNNNNSPSGMTMVSNPTKTSGVITPKRFLEDCVAEDSLALKDMKRPRLDVSSEKIKQESKSVEKVTKVADKQKVANDKVKIAETNKQSRSVDNKPQKVTEVNKNAKILDDSKIVTPITNGDCLLQKTVVTNCYDCKRELSCTFTGENERSLPIKCPTCYKATMKNVSKLPCPGLVKIDMKSMNKVEVKKTNAVNKSTNDTAAGVVDDAETKNSNKKNDRLAEILKTGSEISKSFSDLSVIRLQKTKSDKIAVRKSCDANLMAKKTAADAKLKLESKPEIEIVKANKVSPIPTTKDEAPKSSEVTEKSLDREKSPIDPKEVTNEQETNDKNVEQRKNGFKQKSSSDSSKSNGKQDKRRQSTSASEKELPETMDFESDGLEIIELEDPLGGVESPKSLKSSEQKSDTDNTRDSLDSDGKLVIAETSSDLDATSPALSKTPAKTPSKTPSKTPVKTLSKTPAKRSIKITRTTSADETPLKKSSRSNSTPVTTAVTSSSPVTLQQHCAVCNFDCEDMTEFRCHILTHRDVNTAYQCMECGLSFMVKPTLQKHLLIKHSVKDVDRYIEENKECVDKEAVRAVLTNIIVGPTAADVEENQCRICKERFENSADHDKHFRVHGMAFLKQKELDKITAET